MILSLLSILHLNQTKNYLFELGGCVGAISYMHLGVFFASAIRDDVDCPLTRSSQYVPDAKQLYFTHQHNRLIGTKEEPCVIHKAASCYSYLSDALRTAQKEGTIIDRSLTAPLQRL